MENFTAHLVALATPALLIVVVVAMFRLLRRRRSQVSFHHLRGRALRTDQQVEEALAHTPPTQGIRLGRHLLPHRVAYGHFAIVGATGSGKTLLRRLLMQSVLPRIGKGLISAPSFMTPSRTSFRCSADWVCVVPSRRFIRSMPGASRGTWRPTSPRPPPPSRPPPCSCPKAQQDANPFFSNAARHLMSAALLH